MKDVLAQASLRPSFRAYILGFCGDELVVERLKEIGFSQGSKITFLNRAPFHGPLLFQLSGVVIALREEEARCLSLKLLP